MRRIHLTLGLTLAALFLVGAPVQAAQPVSVLKAKSCSKLKGKKKKACIRKKRRHAAATKPAAPAAPVAPVAVPPAAPAAPAAPDPAEIAAKAKQATIDAFMKAHTIWSLPGNPGDVITVEPTCTALTETLAKCDFYAKYVTAVRAFDISRSGKSTVTFYPLAVDAVLSDETCTDRISQQIGIKSSCGLF